jgi:hypothetical protein
MPLNELDFNAMLSNPLWGQDWENKGIRDLLKNTRIKVDEKGNPLYHEEVIEEKNGKKKTIRYLIAEEKSEYETLSFLTRDFRVGNLARFGGEYDYCKRWTKIAHGVLQYGLKKSHIIALANVAAELELSQSRGGFFRKEGNTLYEHLTKEEIDPKKRSLFGGGKKSKGEYY